MVNVCVLPSPLLLLSADTVTTDTVTVTLTDTDTPMLGMDTITAKPPVDLYWFFEISIRTEKKNQLELKKNFSYKLAEVFFQCSLKFFFSSRLRTEKKNSVS